MIHRLILVVFFALFFSCDDGDFEIESFDFSGSTTNSCNQDTDNFFLYRLSANETLIIKIPESVFNYDSTPLESPNTLGLIPIDGNVIQVIYRLYNGGVTNNTLCSFLPPITPNVVEEWEATSGNIRIITNVSKVSNTSVSSANATRINGYNHEIEFINITFSKPNGTEQFYDVLDYGSFQNPSVNSLVSFTGLLFQCNDVDRVALYKTTANQAIVLQAPNSLFLAEVTLENQPRVAYFDEDNLFNYLILNESFTISNPFCSGGFEALENWTAQNGDPLSQTGRIEVTTIQSSEGFEHTVVLKKAVLERGNVNFTYGDAFTLGTFILN